MQSHILQIQQTTDQGFIMTGYYGANFTTIHDVWVIKMEADGEIEWQFSFKGNETTGTDENEWAQTVLETPNDGYIVCGNTNSEGNGDYDILILKLSGEGAIEWQKTYGSTGDDRAYALQITSDGGYIVTGYTYSYGSGGADLWVLKLNEAGECPPMDTDSSLERYVPAPGIISPAGVEIVITMSSADTTCIVNENPDVTVIPLIP